jgi:hypothetical protein
LEDYRIDEIRTAIGLLPPDAAVDLDGSMVFDDPADGVFKRR